MNKREIAEHLIASVNAFDDTVGSNINPLQVEALADALRQDAILAKYNGSRYLAAAKRIDPDWVQSFELTIDKAAQDINADFIVVDCPKPISINQNTDGFIYVGRKNKIAKFYKAQSMDEIATLNARGFINNGKDIVYIYTDNQLKIYGNNALEKLWVSVILQNPSQQPGFDEEYDDYPVSMDILTMMVDLFKEKMRIAVSQPADTISDMAPTNSVRQEKNNLV